MKMSSTSVSFEQPEYTANTTAIGTLRILEAIRILKLQKKTIRGLLELLLAQ